ncbi:MAG: fibronectin type III domain-containing protein [Marinilabiliales bacterium]|nr:fibronectin type III domain-containing protein [Marinilabiliales bacterium]
MKKILLSLVTLLVATGLAAQPLVYTPTLKSPENAAEGQMPDVTVSWFAISGSLNLKYQLQIDTTMNFNSTQKVDVVQTLITGFKTDELLFGTTYYWRVRAIDGDTSYWSEVWNFTVVQYGRAEQTVRRSR